MVKKSSIKLQKLVRKRSFSRGGLLIFILVFGVVGYILWRSFAAPPPPTVYLAPASQTFSASTSFSVQVRENSGTTTVNAVQANLSYPASLVDFVSIDATNSAFAIQAQSIGGTGTINIARGTCGGCAAVTGDQLVATINFKTKTTGGSAAVAFTAGTILVNAVTNQDILGSLSATGGGTYTIDTTPPTVSAISPADGATLALGSTVPISISATDNDRVASVDIFIDSNKVATLTSAPYTYNWNSTGYSLGTHAINATAVDPSGNLQGFKPINVTLADQTAPTAPLNFHSTGSSLTGIDLAWNASTDNIGVTSYKIKRGATVIATITPPTLTYSDSGLASSTSYSYSIQAFDAAGNASTATTLTTSTLNPKIGDLNNDGRVDLLDISILLVHWQTSDANSDLNHDGTVDLLDLSVLLSHYGT